MPGCLTLACRLDVLCSADPQEWGCNIHHIVGQVLAGCAGHLLLGWDESHPPRDVAAALCLMDWHWTRTSGPLLVSLQNGMLPRVGNTLRILLS